MPKTAGTIYLNRVWVGVDLRESKVGSFKEKVWNSGSAPFTFQPEKPCLIWLPRYRILPPRLRLPTRAPLPLAMLYTI